MPAVDVVIRSSDTIVAVDRYSGEVIRDIPDRASLRRGQTPQGFHFGVLREAYRRAGEDDGSGWTDDCGVVLRYLPTIPIGVVEGDEHNIKITRPVGAALRDKVIAVFGGSSGIGRRICDFAAESGAQAYVFSRSGSGTDVADSDSVTGALARAQRGAGSSPVPSEIPGTAALHLEFIYARACGLQCPLGNEGGDR